MTKENSAETFDRLLYIETYGCQMNVADSEVVAAVMETAGYAEICRGGSFDGGMHRKRMVSERKAEKEFG